MMDEFLLCDGRACLRQVICMSFPSDYVQREKYFGALKCALHTALQSR